MRIPLNPFHDRLAEWRRVVTFALRFLHLIELREFAFGEFDCQLVFLQRHQSSITLCGPQPTSDSTNRLTATQVLMAATPGDEVTGDEGLTPRE
jgi:hypothetical protein